METQLPSPVSLGLWVLLVLGVVSGQEQKFYYKAGSSVTIDPKISAAITSIEWKFKTDIAAEFVEKKVPLNFYEPFKDNAELNLTTGALTITKTDSRFKGDYTLEVNGNISPTKFTIVELPELPKPKVWIQPVACSKDRSSCDRVCEVVPTGTDDSKYGPITYSWREDSGEWTAGEKTMSFLKTETGKIKTFSCRAKSPVDEKESKAEPNPFYQPSPDPVPPILGTIIPIVIIVVLGVVGYKQKWHQAILKHFRGEGNAGGVVESPDPDNRGENGEVTEKLTVTDNENATS